MARMRDRIVIFIIAGAFLLSSFGGIIFIIWQTIQDGKKPDSAATATSQTSTDANTDANKPKSEGKPMDNFTPIAKIEKLETIDTQPGTGSEAKAGDTVTVDYTGAVAATGKIFQSSLDTGQPVTFGLDQVIAGWKEGIPGMKAGGKRRLLIPAAQAYGSNPPQGSGIPVDADLVFDVTLHSIGQ